MTHDALFATLKTIDPRVTRRRDADAWRAARALTWYFGSQSFDRFFAVCFPDHEAPPEGIADHYRGEWLKLWNERKLGDIFGRLDFERQCALCADVLDLYDHESAVAFGEALAKRGRA